MIQIPDDALLLPLELIFENHLRHGIFPYMWKEANVVPVHKKNLKNLKQNYRSISLLPMFGKILEKLVFNVLYQQLDARRFNNYPAFVHCSQYISSI